MTVRPVLFQDASQPIPFAELLQYMVRFLQPLNASLPMVLTLLGMMMVFSDSQKLNALLPMLFSSLGRYTLSNDVQDEKV